jgi:hypothetical protein
MLFDFIWGKRLVVFSHFSATWLDTRPDAICLKRFCNLVWIFFGENFVCCSFKFAWFCSFFFLGFVKSPESDVGLEEENGG